MGVTIMSKTLTSKEITQIPKDIQKLLGKPPVLPNENPKVYTKLLLKVADSIQPTEVIGWLLIKDLVDHSWEIIRLRRILVELVELWILCATDRSIMARTLRCSVSPPSRDFCPVPRHDLYGDGAKPTPAAHCAVCR
jgi:hypothetical protein